MHLGGLLTRNRQCQHRRQYSRIHSSTQTNIADGDIVKSDIYGDDVNLTARIQEAARAGEICIVGSVYDQISGKIKLSFNDIGHRKFKNISQSVRVFEWFAGSADAPSMSGTLFFENIRDVGCKWRVSVIA